MLKNYSVNIRNIKVNRENHILNYLSDNEHKNHTTKNTKIIELSNMTEWENLNNLKLLKNQENRKRRGGAKLKVSNKLLYFNVPPTYEANENEMKKINYYLIEEIKKLYKSYEIEIEDNEIYSVLHQQENPHLHIILPYLDKNGNAIRKVKSKEEFYIKLKFLFTHIVDKVLETDYKQYKTLSEDKQEHNQVIRYLNELKASYELYMQLDLSEKEEKYYKNQIVALNRLLEANPQEKDKKLLRAKANFEKVQSNRASSGKSIKKVENLL